MALSLASEAGLRAAVLNLCLASKVYDLRDQEMCLAIAHVLQSWQVSAANIFVQDHAQVPILHIYSSDATPIWTATQTSHLSQVRGTRVTRKGILGVDYLLQRRYLKSTSPGGATDMHAVVAVPLPMKGGRTADHHLGAALEFCPLLQELGSQSVVISQYVFDRAIFSSLGKRMHQRHAATHTQRSSSSLHGQRLSLLDWDVSIGCCNHDCHNALKWALRSQEPFDEHCKNLFLILDTLRHSFQYILEALPAFLQQSLRVRDDSNEDTTLLVEFWNAMGVAADTSNALAALNLWWDGQTLWVSPDQAQDFDLVSEVSQLLTSKSASLRR